MTPQIPPPPSTEPYEEENPPPFIEYALTGFFTVLLAPVAVFMAPFALLGWVIEKVANPKGESK